MATDTLEIIIKSKATGEGAQKAKGGLDKLKKAAMLAAAGFAALKGAQAAVDFVKFGAGVQRQSEALDNLAKAAGTSGDAIVKAIQGASDFTIDRMTAMTAANKAMMLDVAKSPEQFERLAKVATRLGQAMGQDAAKSIDDFVTAAGRQSIMIADNLGLTIKAGEANEAYARKIGKTAEALTAAEKKQAFLNAMLIAGESKMGELGEGSDNAATKIEKLTAAAADAKVGLAEMAAEMFDSAVNVDELSKRVRGLPSTVSKLGDLANAAIAAGEGFLQGKDGVEEFNRAMLISTGIAEEAAEKARWMTDPRYSKGMKDVAKVTEDATDAVFDWTKKAEDSISVWGRNVPWAADEAALAMEELAEAEALAGREADEAARKAADLAQAEEDAAARIVTATASMAMDASMNLKTMLAGQVKDRETATQSVEDLEREHQARLREIDATGGTEERNAENARYMEARTSLNAHLVEQEAAHTASMGRFVLQAFTSWAQMNGISAEKMLEMRTAIALEYGLIDTETATVMNNMVGSWDTWASGVGTSTADAIADMKKITEAVNSIPTSRTIDINVQTKGNIPAQLGQPIALQHGTPYARGGAAIVGEAGPELVYLPPGSRVYDAAQTQRRINGGSMTNNFYIYATEMDGRAIAAEVDRYMRMAGLRRIT